MTTHTATDTYDVEYLDRYHAVVASAPFLPTPEAALKQAREDLFGGADPRVKDVVLVRVVTYSTDCRPVASKTYAVDELQVG